MAHACGARSPPWGPFVLQLVRLRQFYQVGYDACRALSRSWAGCRELQLTEAPLVDLEVRGVPALQYFGSQAWK